MSLINQSLGIMAAFIFVFVWQLLGLEELTVPIIGVLALGYLFLSRRAKKTDTKNIATLDEMTTSILTALVLILIVDTGGLTSPIFFLLYFIPFAICFVLLPEAAIVYLAGVALLFLPTALDGDVTNNLIKLGSIVLITPLAYFFGKEYRVVSEHQNQDNETASRISNEAANILKDNATTLAEEDKAQLADIIQESEQLKD
jgi:positive regulator of sigma E activity